MSVDEHTIELAGSPIYYRSATAPDVPPLYLHGVPTSSDDWTGFLARTGGLAPDLIGFGRSGKAGNLDYSIDGLADFLEQFLDRVRGRPGPARRATTGAGRSALAFAQRHPERIERIALLNAVPLLAGFRWHRIARLWRNPLLGELAMGSTTRWLLGRSLRRGSVNAGAWPPDRVRTVYEQFDQGTQRAILRLYRSAAEQRSAGAGAAARHADDARARDLGPARPMARRGARRGLRRRAAERDARAGADAGHWPWLDQPERDRPGRRVRWDHVDRPR